MDPAPLVIGLGGGALFSLWFLSQDLFRMSFLVHQAELQIMGVLSSLLVFHEICVILVVLTLY